MCKKISDAAYWHIQSALDSPSSPNNVQLISNLRSKNILDTDCICSTCRLKYTRKRPVQTDLHGSQLHCCVCQSTSASSYHHVDFCKAEVESILGLPSNTVCCSEVSLCRTHYNKILDVQNQRTCCVCSRKSSKRYEVCNFRNVNKLTNDIVWYKKFHDMPSSVVKPTDFMCNVCRCSVERFSETDDYNFVVHSDISTLQQRFARYHHIVDTFNKMTSDKSKCVEFGFASMMLHLESELLCNKPLLLQTLLSFYTDFMTHQFSFCDKPDPGIFKQKISNAVGGVVLFSTIKGQPRSGTMLRRCGSDPLEMLHCSLLQQSSNSNNDLGFSGKEPCSSAPVVQPSSSIPLKLREVAEYLNTQLVQHASLMKEAYSPQGLVDFSVKSQVQNLPPHVWNFIMLLTLGKNEKIRMQQDGRGKFDWDSHFDFSIIQVVIFEFEQISKTLFYCSLHGILCK